MYSSLRLARGPRVSKVICVRGGILDSVMRENISFVLTLYLIKPRASLEQDQ